MKNEIKIINVIKNKKTYKIITTDGDYTFDESTLIKHLVFKDKVFTKDEFENILNDLDNSKALNKVLNYLSYGMKSIYEIKEYLKEYSNADIVIKKLEELGYLNDSEFAKNYLDYTINNLKGPNYYINKLAEKKVDQEYIHKYLNLYTESLQDKNIETITNKLIKINSNKPPKAIKTILLTKLLRDGYSNDKVYSFINSVEINDDSDESLKIDFDKICKKYSSKEISTQELKQKIINNLMSKGYEYRKIIQMFE